MFQTIPFLYFLLCGILGIVLWLNMLVILEDKKKKVKYTHINFKQFYEFYTIIREEKDKKNKLKYSVLLWSQIALIPIYFFGIKLLI